MALLSLTLARAIHSGRFNMDDLRDMAARTLRGERERKGRSPKAKAPGPTVEERRAAADRLELDGKAKAKARAGGRCEWHEGAARCACLGTDADHVLGGRWKKDMEALPNGEGFQILCAGHHHIDKHGSDRRGALRQAKAHALRIGSRGLLRHVEQALARYEARRGGNGR